MFLLLWFRFEVRSVKRIVMRNRTEVFFILVFIVVLVVFEDWFLDLRFRRVVDSMGLVVCVRVL